MPFPASGGFLRPLAHGVFLPQLSIVPSLPLPHTLRPHTRHPTSSARRRGHRQAPRFPPSATCPRGFVLGELPALHSPAGGGRLCHSHSRAHLRGLAIAVLSKYVSSKQMKNPLGGNVGVPPCGPLALAVGSPAYRGFTGTLHGGAQSPAKTQWGTGEISGERPKASVCGRIPPGLSTFMFQAEQPDAAGGRGGGGAKEPPLGR